MDRSKKSWRQPASITTILDVNDDCLQAVFAFLDLPELTIMADVSTQFRRNALQSVRLKPVDIRLDCSSVSDYSKLRNFGAFVKSVDVFVYWCGPETRAKYQKRFIELLSLHCTGMNIDLKISEFDITDEIASLMRPLLARVQKLHFSHCKLNIPLLKSLSSWTPELHELQFFYTQEKKNQFKSLGQKFPNLEMISFSHEGGLSNNHIAEFLKQNPQLKQIELKNCYPLDESILQKIVLYAPQIEIFEFTTGNEQKYKGNIKYFRQLREMKSLILEVRCDPQYIQSTVHEIGSANIRMESLDLTYFDLSFNTRQFIEGISKIQTLKTLRLSNVFNLRASHLIEICKQLKELTEIQINCEDFKMTVDELLNLIQNAEKLESFWYFTWGTVQPTLINIGAETFKQLVRILGQRSEKTHLYLRLSDNHFDTNVPDALIKAASDLLTFRIR